SDRSGAAECLAGELVAGGIGRRYYTAGGRWQAEKREFASTSSSGRGSSRLLDGFGPLCRDFLGVERRHADVHRESSPLFANKSSSSREIRVPAAGSRKLSVPTATSVAPASSMCAACKPFWTPPMPTTGIETRWATARTCAKATARMAGPER